MKKTSNHLQKLIYLMSDGKYHSGELLSQQLGVTRAAVWKIIKQLQEKDICIESKQSFGYKLAQPLILLCAEELKKSIPAQFDVHLLNSTTSTIDYCKKNKRNSLVCLAEEQTQASGRMGKNWASPFGHNIYYSQIWHTQLEPSELAGLSLSVGLSIIKALNQYGIDDLMLKWPNDIYHQDKKLAGILIHLLGEMNGQSQLIISFGLNVNMQQQPIDQRWTSLIKIKPTYHDRNSIVSLILQQLNQDLALFESNGFSASQHEWQQYDYLFGKSIELINHQHIDAGVACGINEYGQLLLKKSDHTIKAFAAGDVSVKK